MRPFRWALIQLLRRKFGHTRWGAQRLMHKGKTLKRGSKSQASASQGQNPQRKPPHQHLDLGLPASRL